MAKKDVDGNIVPRGKVRVGKKMMQLIDAYLDQLSFQDGYASTFNDAFNALTAEIVELHKAYIDKHEVAVAVQLVWISHYNQRLQLNPLPPQGTLKDAENASYREEVKDGVVQFVESIPRECVYRITLPNIPISYTFDLPITSNIKLISEVIPATSTAGAMSRLASALSKPTVELQISLKGYPFSSRVAYANSEFASLCKQVSYLMAVHGIAADRWSAVKAVATVDQDQKGVSSVRLPHSVEGCFSGLQLRQDKLVVMDDSPEALKKTLLGRGTRPVQGETEFVDSLRSLLVSITRFFECTDDPDFGRIAAAIEWYQDAEFSDNETFAYLAACIGLESLLGQQDNLDEMTNRLCDRYAFMMGRGRREREELHTSYKEILKVRGSIVHAKLAKLPDEDAAKLDKVRVMLQSVIQHELNHMVKRNEFKKRKST